MDVFWSWPPVTRTLVAATVGTSILVHGGMLSPVYVAFFSPLVFTTREFPQIWRLVSSFLVTGPKFGLLMDPYFLYTYASGLEIGSPRFSEPGSFFVYNVFVMAFILVVCGKFLGGVFFLQPLILAYAYTFSQDNPHSNVTIYILTFPAKYLPYALIALTFVMDGPHAAKFQLGGLLAAHAYDFLTRIWPTFGGGSNWLKTPDFVKRWFIGSGRPTPQTRSYGTAFQPRQQAPASSGSSWSNTRGPGRRLGG
ncbi:uncharacterized protein PV09_00410 [Verruconis gallopava]|uniref:Derlin n=1 Tax=Verruconis gallopava TaxID=253628 RepID=A0A0D1Z9A3_9PEZI|nr:uncharacterized protein PV09_00410 [Verruconis gallopava]KIW09537.1 hypothetical protein PV09_00410 [Verruconis gallopava]